MFWWENLRKSDHLENTDVDERILFRWNFRNWDVRAIDWIDVVQDKDSLQPLVNAVITFWFS